MQALCCVAAGHVCLTPSSRLPHAFLTSSDTPVGGALWVGVERRFLGPALPSMHDALASNCNLPFHVSKTQEVLRSELGLGDAEVQRLRDGGAI